MYKWPYPAETVLLDAAMRKATQSFGYVYGMHRNAHGQRQASTTSPVKRLAFVKTQSLFVWLDDRDRRSGDAAGSRRERTPPAPTNSSFRRRHRRRPLVAISATGAFPQLATPPNPRAATDTCPFGRSMGRPAALAWRKRFLLNLNSLFVTRIPANVQFHDEYDDLRRFLRGLLSL